MISKSAMTATAIQWKVGVKWKYILMLQLHCCTSLRTNLVKIYSNAFSIQDTTSNNHLPGLWCYPLKIKSDCFSQDFFAKHIRKIYFRPKFVFWFAQGCKGTQFLIGESLKRFMKSVGANEATLLCESWNWDESSGFTVTQDFPSSCISFTWIFDRGRLNQVTLSLRRPLHQLPEQQNLEVQSPPPPFSGILKSWRLTVCLSFIKVCFFNMDRILHILCNWIFFLDKKNFISI